MNNDKILLLSGKIYRDRNKFSIVLNEKNRIESVSYIYIYRNKKEPFKDFNNTLKIKDGDVFLTNEYKDIDFPMYLYEIIDVFRLNPEDKYTVDLINDWTYEELIEAFRIAKSKENTLDEKKSQSKQDIKMINEMRKYS